jgi:hypothetical protein
MLGLTLLYATSWAFSIFLGSLGVFFFYFSFQCPDTAAYAIIFLIAATALAWALASDRDYKPNNRIR